MNPPAQVKLMSNKCYVFRFNDELTANKWRSDHFDQSSINDSTRI